MLGYEEDEDFAEHHPVDIETVKAFEEDGGPGPDLADLHFDTTRGLTSKWNQKAFELIRIDFCARNRKDRNFPSRPNRYFIDLIQNRFKRLWNKWKRAQARVNSDGDVEDDDALELRMVESKVIDLKTSHLTTRRLEVRNVIIDNLATIS